MAYKILRISGLHYRQAEVLLYESNPNLKNESYERQQEEIFKLCLVYGDSFSRGLRLIGYEAVEVLYDVDNLQIAWAEENGLPIDIYSRDWRFQVVMAQIKKFKPDIVYFQDVHGLPSEYRRLLKSVVQSIKLIVLHKGYPGSFDEMGDFDIVLLSMPSLVDMYRERGIPSQLHYHGFNGQVLSRLPLFSEINKSKSVTFLGSSGYGHGSGHRTRYWSLMRLFQETELIGFIDEQFSRKKSHGRNFGKLQSYIPMPLINLVLSIIWQIGPTSFERLTSLLNQMRGRKLTQKSILSGCFDFDMAPPGPIADFFGERCHGPIFGLEMYQVLAGSSVTLNMHADATGNSVGNLRMFEATGSGACLLTNNGPNMRDLFEPDVEVVAYDTLEECLEKIDYLMEHSAEREKIAYAGMKRTHQDHTVEMRVKKLHDIFHARLLKH